MADNEQSEIKVKKIRSGKYFNMQKNLFIVLLFLVFTAQIYSQVDYSFSGYVVDFPVYSSMNKELAGLFGIDRNQFLNLTRLRLRPDVYLWNGARISAEYEADILYSKQNLFSFLNPVSTNRQILNLRWNIYDKKNFNVSHYFDRLYFRQGFSNGNIIIGRQRIAWGVGRIWSPIDLFNPINPANYSKIEKDGADAVSFTYSFGNFTDLNLVYNPQDKIQSSNAGFRFRTNFDEYDIAVIGGHFDNRFVAGGDFAGNFFDAGIRGEGIISMDKYNLNNNFVRFIFGMDNQFTSKLYGMFEYQFNGEGSADKNSYDLRGLLEGRIINLSRNYLFVSASYQITPLLTATAAENANLNDGSGFFNLSGSYSLSDNSTLNLGVLFSYGSRYSEYWYYPSSIYLQGQWFF